MEDLLNFLRDNIAGIREEDIAFLLDQMSHLTEDERQFINQRSVQLLAVDQVISTPPLGNHEIKKQLLELQFNSLRLYLMRNLPDCEDVINKIFGTITGKITLVNDVLKKGLNRQPSQQPSSRSSQQAPSQAHLQAHSRSFQQPSRESQADLVAREIGALELAKASSPVTPPPPLPPFPLQRVLSELKEQQAELKQPEEENSDIEIPEDGSVAGLEGNNLAGSLIPKLDKQEDLTDIILGSRNISQKGGELKPNIQKFGSIITNLFIISLLFNSHLFVQLMTLMSYKEEFDVFWGTFSKQNSHISKEDFIKLFFINLNKRKTLNEKIQQYLPETELESLRDTLIYKQYINDESTQVLFIGNAIGKLQEYNSKQTDYIEALFANTTIAVDLSNFISEISKKMKGIFLKPKDSSLSQYDLLWSQKAVVNQSYESLAEKTTKVETFVKIRHDGSINPRFKFLELSDSRLGVEYYNIDGEIEPTNLDSLKKGTFEQYIFGPFSGIFLQGTKNLKMATDIFNRLKLKLDRQEELFFIGYGTSGSGKTGAFIYLSFIKDNVTYTEPGVLEYFCNLLCKNYNYTCLEITMVDFFLYFANTSTNADTFLKQHSQVKPIKVDGLEILKFKATDDKTWNLTTNPSKALGTCINQAFDSREVNPTSNNVDSSRSHVLVFLTITKINTRGETITQKICVGDLAGVENVLDCPKIMNKMDVAYAESKKWKENNIPIDPVVMEQVKNKDLEKYLNLSSKSINGTLQSNSQHAAKFKVRQTAGAEYEINPIPDEIKGFENISRKSKEYFGSEIPEPKFPLDYSYNKCSALTSIKEFYNPELSPEENIKLLEAQISGDSVLSKSEAWEDIMKAMTIFNDKNGNKSNLKDVIIKGKTVLQLMKGELTASEQLRNGEATLSNELKTFLNTITGKKGSNPIVLDVNQTQFSNLTSNDLPLKITIPGKRGAAPTPIQNPYANAVSNLQDLQCKVLRVMKLKYNCELRKMEGFMINRTLKDMRIDIEALVKRSTKIARNEKNLAHLLRAAENIGKLRGYNEKTNPTLKQFIENYGKTSLPLIFDNNVHPYCRNSNMSIINPYKIFYKPQSTYDNETHKYLPEDPDKFNPTGILMETIQNKGFNLSKLNFIIFTVVHVSQTVTDKKIPVNNPPPIPFIPINNLKSGVLSNNLINIKDEINKLKQVLSKYTFYKDLYIALLSQKFQELDIIPIDDTTINNLAKILVETIEANNSATTLGTLYATDILKNSVEHPYACMINPESTKTFTKFNEQVKLIKTPQEIDSKLEVRKKYLKYKAKYLELKKNITNRK